MEGTPAWGPQICSKPLKVPFPSSIAFTSSNHPCLIPPFLFSTLLLPLQAPYLLKKIPHHIFVLTCPVLHLSPPPFFFFHPAPNLPISILPAWTMVVCTRNRTSYHGPGTVVMFYRTVRSSSQCYDYFTNEEIEAQRGEMNIASK